MFISPRRYPVFRRSSRRAPISLLSESDSQRQQRQKESSTINFGIVTDAQSDIERMYREFEQEFDIMDRRGGVYELVPHGCSKGTAVDYALKQFQLEKEDAYVFGDSSNDLTMFRCGAHTIALGKHDEVLDPYTEYVTDTVERDGVAKAMEHYGLI